MIAQNEGGRDVKTEGRSVSSEGKDVNERDRAQDTEIAVLLREDVRTLKLLRGKWTEKYNESTKSHSNE